MLPAAELNYSGSWFSRWSFPKGWWEITLCDGKPRCPALRDQHPRENGTESKAAENRLVNRAVERTLTISLQSESNELARKAQRCGGRAEGERAGGSPGAGVGEGLEEAAGHLSQEPRNKQRPGQTVG